MSCDRLEELNLSGSAHLKPEDLYPIRRLNKLKSLALNNVAVDDAVVLELIQLPELSGLAVDGERLSPEVVSQARKAVQNLSTSI